MNIRPFASQARVPERRRRRIGRVSSSGERLGEDLACPRTGERFRLEEGERLVAC